MPNYSRVHDIELDISGPKARSNRPPKKLRGDKRRAYRRSRNNNTRSQFSGTEDAFMGHVYTLAPNRNEVY